MSIMWKLNFALLCGFRLFAADLRVAGEDLAWKVETAHFIVDLSKNPGTGRNGQINTIFVKDPGILLTRARPTSTLHLSPNSAAGKPWAGINRWDPPARYSARPGPASFRLEREGPMPNVPGLWVKTVYEIPSDRPVIHVEESVEATADAPVTLLRLCEWSFAPGPENPFSHVGWADGEVRRKDGEMTLPLRTRWMGFYSESRRFAFVAVIHRLETSLLAGESARFGGDPHYFYRILIGKPVTIPRGARYAVAYTIHCFRPHDAARPFATLNGASGSNETISPLVYFQVTGNPVIFAIFVVQ